MATLADIANGVESSPADENSTPNAFVSALAGIGSGLFKIPEGFVSLGATLIDLGADTNKAAEVEEFFAKINPIIQDYMDENSISLLFEQKNVFIGKNSLDITDEIVKKINEKFKQ